VRAEDGLTAEALRSGGYVIFFRHVLADQGIDGNPTVLRDCATQRNIGEQGLLAARTIGQGFRDQAIPVGDVLSSEYCRALETAGIAFGRVQPEVMLEFCCPVDRPQTDEQRAAFLAAALATPPPPGVNTVLIGHGVGIMADLQQGEAGIYRPDGRGGFERIARVLPSEWARGVYGNAR
jgi:phosphohistidine phosphatase SixA